MEAYVAGVSTRAVDDLVAALGIDSGISKSEVSRICGGLDEVVTAFRTRRLDHTEFPYVYLDATYLHVRNSTSQVVSMAVVVATGITADGRREVLGLDVGESEDEVFWRGFLSALKRRGLTGVRLVISDQHAALVAAVFRTIFAQPDAATVAVAATWDEVRDQLGGRFPKIGTLMDAAKADVLAFTAFPRPHWPKIWSTNPLERVTRRSNAGPGW
jgi:putative transposase